MQTSAAQLLPVTSIATITIVITHVTFSANARHYNVVYPGSTAHLQHAHTVQHELIQVSRHLTRQQRHHKAAAVQVHVKVMAQHSTGCMHMPDLLCKLQTSEHSSRRRTGWAIPAGWPACRAKRGRGMQRQAWQSRGRLGQHQSPAKT
jgi:hypothetical protein